MTTHGAPLLSSAAMSELDRRTIEVLGVPSLVLMESAAWACCEEILERWGDRLAEGIAVVCGPGNNGGDGLAVARRLHLRGLSVTAILVAEADRLSADAARQLRLAQGCEVPIRGVSHDLGRPGVVVDALFGTGLARPVEGRFADAVAAIGDAGAPVLAVDIPSGVSGSTGEVLGAAVQADVTVAFEALKLGHLTSPGRSRCGALVRADIGIPVHRWPDVTEDAVRLLGPAALDVVGLGPQAAHKGTFGHLLVVAGGPGKTGAARLTCEAALRAGAGLVTLVTFGDLPAGLPAEVMTEDVGPPSGGGVIDRGVDRILELLEARSALAIGPGLGTESGTRGMVRDVVARAQVPAVLDADALNAFAPLDGRIPGRDRVLTPHPGELRRLLPDGPPDRLAQVRALQARSGATCLLKGAGTLVACGDAVWLNPTGNPGMGTAGSGDVLTGILGALLARGIAPSAAAQASAYWHGLAGDLAGATPGLIASDLIAHLPPAWIAARDRAVLAPFTDRP